MFWLVKFQGSWQWIWKLNECPSEEHRKPNWISFTLLRSLTRLPQSVCCCGVGLRAQRPAVVQRYESWHKLSYRAKSILWHRSSVICSGSHSKENWGQLICHTLILSWIRFEALLESRYRSKKCMRLSTAQFTKIAHYSKTFNSWFSHMRK